MANFDEIFGANEFVKALVDTWPEISLAFKTVNGKPVVTVNAHNRVTIRVGEATDHPGQVLRNAVNEHAVTLIARDTQIAQAAQQAQAARDLRATATAVAIQEAVRAAEQNTLAARAARLREEADDALEDAEIKLEEAECELSECMEDVLSSNFIQNVTRCRGEVVRLRTEVERLQALAESLSGV